MRIVYAYTEGSTPIYITGGGGVQRVLLSFVIDNNAYVYFCDDYLRHTYVNQIIDKRAIDLYALNNFKRIETDEEFYYLTDKIEKLFNYNGKHLDKIDGHDLGGATLVDQFGNTLID